MGKFLVRFLIQWLGKFSKGYQVLKSSQCMHAYLCMSVFVSELFVCLRLLCHSVSPSFLSWQSFGPETQSIITLNLPAGVFPFVVKGCLCFSLYFTYPGKLGSLKFRLVHCHLKEVYCQHHTHWSLYFTQLWCFLSPKSWRECSVVHQTMETIS